LRATLLRTRQINDFTVDVESQRSHDEWAEGPCSSTSGEKSPLHS
jgi:hypothetical protein